MEITKDTEQTKSNETKKVMAMYDVRGIQNYIFKTAKVKDAIGASAIVENIIEEALAYAVEKLNLQDRADLNWCSDDETLRYDESKTAELAVCVLYIGGGNAFVICENKDTYVKISRLMSRYVISHTYSLQLATAMVKKTGNYAEDYTNLMNEMSGVKAKMISSKPLGALPIMAVEVKTGYPASADPEAEKPDKRADNIGTESLKKLKTESTTRKGIEKQIKIFDNYTTKKGVDSTLAVVHIDGNNMGLRIRELIGGKTSYEEAVNEMREISFRINSSFKKVFEDMSETFNKYPGNDEEHSNKNKYFVLKILVAGDDITYVCNGKIALATVDYYCDKISECTMNGKTDKEDKDKYGFSVCAGISYIGSHFPFYTGYEVAEACCESAKESAKKPENMNGDRIGNWVDFQICKNIQAKDLKAMREREYITNHGEQLLVRPYFINAGDDKNDEEWPVKKGDINSLDTLKKYILYFQDEKNIPHSFAKNLRNLYSQGENMVNLFKSFLESRNWKMPDDSNELYVLVPKGKNAPAEEIEVAKYYDALELMDDYVDKEAVLREVKGGE